LLKNFSQDPTQRVVSLWLKTLFLNILLVFTRTLQNRSLATLI